jgi:hypothetical protein
LAGLGPATHDFAAFRLENHRPGTQANKTERSPSPNPIFTTVIQTTQKLDPYAMEL